MTTSSTHRGPHWIASVLDLADVPTENLNDAKHELQRKVQTIEAQLGGMKDVPLTDLLPTEREWRTRAKQAMRLTIMDIDRIKMELDKRTRIPKVDDGRRRAIDILEDIVAQMRPGYESESYGFEMDTLITEVRRLLALREAK